MGRKFLSKSSFIRGFQCEKSLYLHKFKKDLADPITEQSKLIFQRGTEVGLLAQDLFPGGVDLSPIADLMKSEVFELAKSLNINKEILDAPPTDGLWDNNKTDEDQIGATYNELEWAMTNKNNKNLSKREKEVIKIYNKFHQSNKHKMTPIPKNMLVFLN